MINYTYTINSMTCSQLDPTKPDLVVAVQVSITATDTLDSLGSTMTAMLPLTPSDSFVAFHDLTKETVDAWVAAHPMIPALKKSLDDLIVTKRNPPYVDRKAPWVPVPVNGAT